MNENKDFKLHEDKKDGNPSTPQLTTPSRESVAQRIISWGAGAGADSPYRNTFAARLEREKELESIAQARIRSISSRENSNTDHDPNSSINLPICALCEKVVYSVESVNRAGNIWHKSCFQCGVLSDVGCRRVLLFPAFPEYFYFYGCPFCHGCANKYFLHGRPKFRVVASSGTSSTHPHSLIGSSHDATGASSSSSSSSSSSECGESETDVSYIPQSSVQLKFRSQVIEIQNLTSDLADLVEDIEEAFDSVGQFQPSEQSVHEYDDDKEQNNREGKDNNGKDTREKERENVKKIWADKANEKVNKEREEKEREKERERERIRKEEMTREREERMKKEKERLEQEEIERIEKEKKKQEMLKEEKARAEVEAWFALTEETARKEEETRIQKIDEMVFLTTTIAFEQVVELLFVETIKYAGKDQLAQVALANAQAAKTALVSILELALEGLLFSGVTKIAAEQGAAEAERIEKGRVEQERRREEVRKEEQRILSLVVDQLVGDVEEKVLWEREEELLALAAKAAAEQARMEQEQRLAKIRIEEEERMREEERRRIEAEKEKERIRVVEEKEQERLRREKEEEEERIRIQKEEAERKQQEEIRLREEVKRRQEEEEQEAERVREVTARAVAAAEAAVAAERRREALECARIEAQRAEEIRARRLVEIEEEEVRCVQQRQAAGQGLGPGQGQGLAPGPGLAAGLGPGLVECLLDDKDGSDWDDLSQSTAHLYGNMHHASREGEREGMKRDGTGFRERDVDRGRDESDVNSEGTSREGERGSYSTQGEYRRAYRDKVLAVKKHHYQRSVQSARTLILPPATTATTTTTATTAISTLPSSRPSSPSTLYADDNTTWRDVGSPDQPSQTPSQISAHPSQISAPASQTPRPVTDVAAACEGLFWSPQGEHTYMLYTQPNANHHQAQQPQQAQAMKNDLELLIGIDSSSSSSLSLPLSFATPHKPNQISSQTPAPASQISTLLPPQDEPSTSLDSDIQSTPNPHLHFTPTTTTTTTTSNNNNMSLHTSSYPTRNNNATMSPFSIMCGGGGLPRETSLKEGGLRNGMTGSGGKRTGMESASGPGLGPAPGQGLAQGQGLAPGPGLASGISTNAIGPGCLYTNIAFSNTVALKHKLLSARTSMIPKPREQHPSQISAPTIQISAPSSQNNP